MTTHYKVLRPVDLADLDTSHKTVQILKIIPPDGYAAYEHFKKTGRYAAIKGIRHACSNWILKRISSYERMSRLDSVKFRYVQLNELSHRSSRIGDKCKSFA